MTIKLHFNKQENDSIVNLPYYLVMPSTGAKEERIYAKSWNTNVHVFRAIVIHITFSTYPLRSWQQAVCTAAQGDNNRGTMWFRAVSSLAGIMWAWSDTSLTGSLCCLRHCGGQNIMAFDTLETVNWCCNVKLSFLIEPVKEKQFWSLVL